MKTLFAVLCILAATGALAQAPDGGVADPDAGVPTGVLTKPPELLRQVEAPYPPEAAAQQLEGTVVMLIDISETGAVTNVEVTQPAGHGFDEAAVEAVKQFQFEPAQVDHVPAPVRIQYAYQFVFRPVQPEPSEDGGVAPQAPVNFSGRALERGSRKPLAGAEVVIPDLELSTVADDEGRFSFRGVPLGTHEVLVVLGGYDRFRTKETMSEGLETRATYYVQRRIFSAYETVVRSERERKEVTSTTLQVAEVQRVPGTQGDTLKVVQNLPGVARPAFNGGQLVIRGTSPQESGVFLDGQRIPLLFHFGGLTSVYNSELLDALDYLPGNFSAYYGDITGGVINVRSREPKMDRIHGTAGVSLIESNAVIEGPITDTLGFAIGGRRSYVDLVLGVVPEGDGPSLQVAPRYYDAQLKLVWKPKVLPRHTFSFQGLTSRDRLGLVFDRPSDNDPTVTGALDVTTGFNQLRLRHQYRADALTLDTQALVGNTLVEFEVGVRNLRIASTDLSLRSTAEYVLLESLTLAGGVDVTSNFARVKALIQSPPREGEPPRPLVNEALVTADGDFVQFYPSLWVEGRVSPVKGLLLVPGVRAEGYVFTDQKDARYTLNPRLAVRYALTDAVTLKGGAGVYHGPPIQDEASVDFGNPDLKAKRSLQYSVGAEWQPRQEWFISGEVFYNDLDDLIVRSDALVERDGERVPERLKNGGVGRIYGLEVLIRRSLTERLFGWISYTLSRSERRDAPGAAWRLFDNDQTHVLTAIASYKLPRGWEVGARFRFASGNPTTPVVGAVRDDTNDVFLPLFAAVNSRRLPSFNQLDVRVDKIFVFDTWTLDVYLDLMNAYQNPAVEGIAYNYNYSQSAYFKGLPILPVLGAKGSF